MAEPYGFGTERYVADCINDSTRAGYVVEMAKGHEDGLAEASGSAALGAAATAPLTQ